MGQVQYNLAQDIIGYREFNFVPIKDHVPFQGETIAIYQKYIDEY